MSWAEAKWVVDNLTQKTGQAPNKMRAFTANPLSSTSIGLKFLEPADSYDDAGNLVCAVGGVMIRMSTEGYPASTSDGTLVVNNTELGKYETKTYSVTGLTAGATYYFTAFPYSDKGVYNASGNVSNRASAIAVEGEVARITITIDDTSEFSSVGVTCVDETDSSLTASTTLTSSETVATFAVPAGHNYHMEYGVEYAYTRPEDSASRTAVAGTTTDYAVAYDHFVATINVTYPEGAVLTAENDGVKYTALTSTGSYTFTVHSLGQWIVRITSGEKTAYKTVEVENNGQTDSIRLSYTVTCGIKRSLTSTSPEWARIDDSASFTATATVGTIEGNSDFDGVYPWSGMVRETLDTGDVMVKIPKFYYRRYRDSSYEYIQIAGEQVTSDFVVHPAFAHNGIETDYIYVGAYKTTADHKSASGLAPLVSLTRAEFRTGAQSKGDGWSLIDISTVSAIQMLYLVEFATSNSQAAIGQGHVSASEAISTGTCDNVANLTGRTADADGIADVVYRGIEGFWGNVYEWVDGANLSYSKASSSASASATLYVCNNPAKYADDTSSGYSSLSYKMPVSGWITSEGLDTSKPYVIMPSAAGSTGSETTYECDYVYVPSSVQTSTKWYVLRRGGLWSYGSYAGLFSSALHDDSSSSGTYFGSRLLKIPS